MVGLIVWVPDIEGVGAEFASRPDQHLGFKFRRRCCFYFTSSVTKTFYNCTEKEKSQ